MHGGGGSEPYAAVGVAGEAGAEAVEPAYLQWFTHRSNFVGVIYPTLDTPPGTATDFALTWRSARCLLEWQKRWYA